MIISKIFEYCDKREAHLMYKAFERNRYKTILEKTETFYMDPNNPTSNLNHIYRSGIYEYEEAPEYARYIYADIEFDPRRFPNLECLVGRNMEIANGVNQYIFIGPNHSKKNLDNRIISSDVSRLIIYVSCFYIYNLIEKFPNLSHISVLNKDTFHIDIHNGIAYSDGNIIPQEFIVWGDDNFDAPKYNSFLNYATYIGLFESAIRRLSVYENYQYYTLLVNNEVKKLDVFSYDEMTLGVYEAPNIFIACDLLVNEGNGYDVNVENLDNCYAYFGSPIGEHRFPKNMYMLYFDLFEEGEYGITYPEFIYYLIVMGSDDNLGGTRPNNYINCNTYIGQYVSEDIVVSKKKILINSVSGVSAKHVILYERAICNFTETEFLGVMNFQSNRIDEWDNDKLCIAPIKVLCLKDSVINGGLYFGRLEILYIYNSNCHIVCNEIDLLICEFEGMKMIECPNIREWQLPYNYEVLDLCQANLDCSYNSWLSTLI